MDNPLAKYLNKNLLGILEKIEVYQGQAKDSGQPYYAIDLIFINGYQKRLFLKPDEQFAWVNAIELLETQAQVDSAF